VSVSNIHPQPPAGTTAVDALAAPPGTAGALGIGAIRGGTLLAPTEALRAKWADIIDLRRDRRILRVYPSGIEISRFSMPLNGPPEGGVRGDICGFSHKAARRLRKTFIGSFVPGWVLWSITLTTRRNCTPAEFRAITGRFRHRLLTCGWVGIWRIELQRRGAPHLHVAFWLPPGAGLCDVRREWLGASGESGDEASQRQAVVGREIPADESGWAVYMALHDGKHKAEQLGWKGKQWGLWNGSLLQPRPFVEVELSEREHADLLVWLAQDEADRRDSALYRKLLFACQGNREKADLLGQDLKLGYRESLPLMHEGNLLRCRPGAPVLDAVEQIRQRSVTGEAC
jgi:hypothetical protein